MSICCLVAGDAVERSFVFLESRSGERNRDAVRLLQPVLDLHRSYARALGGRFHLSQADARKRDMIHIGWPRGPSAMFEMAGSAASDVRVKCSRLACERLVIGMTNGASARSNSVDRRMASRAI